MTSHSDNLLDLSFIKNTKSIKLNSIVAMNEVDALIQRIHALVELNKSAEILDLTSLNLENFSLQALQCILANLPTTINEVILDHSFNHYKKELLSQINPDGDELILVFENQVHSESDKTSHTFDKAQDLTEANAKITWVREMNQHAILLVELFEEGKHSIYKVHLRGVLVARKPLDLLKGHTFWGMHYREGKVEVKDLSDKNINITETLTHWYVEKERAQHLLAYAKRKVHEKQYFNLLGEGALSSMFIATIANQLSHSCVTWSREALLHAGINVPLSKLINFATITSYEAKEAQSQPMDAVAMARLARVNEWQSIQTYYPQYQRELSIPGSGYVDPNTILHKATRGPSEFLLGTYSPFMLACAYGHIKTVNTLLGEYGANPYVNTRAKFCFGIMGRYSAFDCAQSLFLRTYTPKVKQQQIMEQLKAVDHKLLIIDALDRYIAQRHEKPVYQNKLSFFGQTVVNLGYKKDEKIAAAYAFQEAIKSGSSIDRKFKGALKQGELGKLFNDYTKYSKEAKISFVKSLLEQESNSLTI